MGLFGKKWQPTGQAMDLRPDANLQQPLPPPPERRGGGLFRQGGIARGIAGTVGDFLMQYNGMQPTYAPAVAEQRKQAAALAEEQRKRSMAREDKLWEWQNKPKEPEGRTSLQQNYDWLVSQGRIQEANNLIERMTDNSEYRVGPDGRFYRVDREQAEVLGADLPEGWTIEGEGGATPGGSPTFREAFADYAR